MWQPNGEELFARYPIKKQGSAEIVLYEVTRHDIEWGAIRAKSHTERQLAYTPPGKYVKLEIDGALMMSSTNMEFITNLPFLDHVKGDVLIGGLGLGLILEELRGREDVRSVTVIEKNPDVIALVAPTVRLDAKIVEGDVFKWQPGEFEFFDTIYMDIWENSTKEEDPEIKRLKVRYKKWLRKGGAIGAWGSSPIKWRTPTGRTSRVGRRGVAV
jgi:hypothetical protein